MNNNDRRILTAGVRISQFNAATVDNGRRMINYRVLQYLSEHVGRKLFACRVIGTVDRFVQIADAGAK
jgi:hypothetical protein